MSISITTLSRSIIINGHRLPTPCFFPSVSSVKTNLLPIDYINLLSTANYPLFLVSAYDIANSCIEDQRSIEDIFNKCQDEKTTILLDCGVYEKYWKNVQDWQIDNFHAICKNYKHNLCFCYDNYIASNKTYEIAKDVIKNVLRDQSHALGTVIPIFHASVDQLPEVVQIVVEKISPIMIAIPERALGEGILNRIKSLQRIRKALNTLNYYCPIHLLGTGNPLSIISYTMAGADSFDGLEWCQTVVNHRTGLLYHFQHWDFFRDQTQWGRNDILPYDQSVLMHNLEFYNSFLNNLSDALAMENSMDFFNKFFPNECNIIMDAIEGNK